MLFGIGSTCFVLGTLPAHVSAVGGQAGGVTFFVGSVLFTSGAYLSYLQVVRHTGRRFGSEPAQAGFRATLIQLVGTV